MHDLIGLLSFSAVPLATALVFALVLPPLGAGLHLRNESLLGIALPPAGSALLALAVALGFDHDQGWVSFAVVAIGLSALAAFLPPGSGPRRVSARSRSLMLGAVFCAANAALLLVLAVSPLAQARLLHSMSGEMLAVAPGALVTVLVAAMIGVALFFMFRGHVFAYLIDEETQRVRGAARRRTSLAATAAAVLAVTGAVLMVGPVLCAGLLILPALLAERRARGLARYLVATAFLGAVGTLGGFLASLLLDWPPAPTAVAGVLIVGLVWRFVPRFG